MMQSTEKSKCPYSYKNDRNKIVFGSVLTLHTFGRDLKWNPHIHCLVCEEAFDTKKNKMKNFSFISYKKLRKTWMYQVLDLLSKQELENFNYLKQRFYKELVNGFYVYAKKKEKDNDDNIASTTLPDTLPDLPWLKTASSNMKMTKR